jgi:hypothetical protein
LVERAAVWSNVGIICAAAYGLYHPRREEQSLYVLLFHGPL